jgi:hypothetical protein
MKEIIVGDVYKFNLEKCGFPHDTLGNLTSRDTIQWKCCIYYASFYSLAPWLGYIITYKTMVIYSWSQPCHIYFKHF